MAIKLFILTITIHPLNAYAVSCMKVGKSYDLTTLFFVDTDSISK